MTREQGAVTNLAPSVIQIENVFSDESLLYLNSYLDNNELQPNEIMPSPTNEFLVTYIEGSFPEELRHTKREVFELMNLQYNHRTIRKEVSNLVANYLDGDPDFLVVKLWKDYPYYQNPIHYDCNDDEHVILVYLTDHSLCGTQYWDRSQGDNTGGTAPDAKHGLFTYFPPRVNWGLCIKNPEKLLHGMQYWVPNGHVRRTVSIIWKSK